MSAPANNLAMQCECFDWTRMEQKGQPLTSHHPYCKHYDPVGDAMKIINALITGINTWALEEDGLHSEIKEAYEKARFFVGRPVVLKEEGEE